MNLCIPSECYSCTRCYAYKYLPEIPLYSKSFAEGCLVSSDEKCWYGNCDHDTCSFDSTYEKPQNSDDPAKWMKWEEVIKNQKSGSVGSLYNYLSSILPDFFIHTFVKRKQAKSYEDDKSEAGMKNPNTAMLQVDFAENYTCTAQDEVQSAHQHDHLKHGKTPIVVFMDQPFSLKNPDINTIKVWSDGPNSQFKNKYVIGSLDLLSKKHDIDIIWNFSATSHGKGSVDDVGATVKREASQKILTRRHAINNLDDFEMAVLTLKNIKITKIPEEEVYEHAAQLDLKELFENARVIPKIT